MFCSVCAILGFIFNILRKELFKKNKQYVFDLNIVLNQFPINVYLKIYFFNTFLLFGTLVFLQKMAKPKAKPDPFLDLVQITAKPPLRNLKQFTMFDLVVFFHKEGIPMSIIQRCKDAQCTGQMFYQMGKRDPASKGPSKWYFFTKVGIQKYEDIANLERIISEYDKVCFCLFF